MAHTPKRFIPPPAIQTKPAQAIRVGGVAPAKALPITPPAWRPQGPALPLQAKHVARPAPFRPQAVVQAKAVLAPQRALAPKTVHARPVIQRARDIQKQDHNYIVQPESDWYERHVRQRISHCVTVILKVWHVVHTARTTQPSPALRRMSSAVTDNALSQVGSGNYGSSAGKLDAAHLMNTTVLPSVLLKGWTPTATQEAMIKELYGVSGATTMQLKSDNVGPDKVIDKCMTEFAQYCAGQCDAGNAPADPDTLVAMLTGACLTRLNASAKSGNPNYTAAISGVTGAVTTGGSTVSDEFNPFRKEFA